MARSASGSPHTGRLPRSSTSGRTKGSGKYTVTPSPVAPIQRATGDYSPINIDSLHTFGTRCFRFVEPGDRKSKLKGTAEAGYYLGPATYCPFFRVLVSAPRSSVLITTTWVNHPLITSRPNHVLPHP